MDGYYVCYVMSCHVMSCDVMFCSVLFCSVLYVCMYVCIFPKVAEFVGHLAGFTCLGMLPHGRQQPVQLFLSRGRLPEFASSVQK